MREKICGIYCIENIVDCRKYIGKSVNIEERIKRHGWLLRSKKDSIHLQRAFDLYGATNFSFSILELCVKNSLDNREKHWIKELNTFGELGYNLTAGGGGPSEIKFSPESILKMSASHKAMSEETKRKMSQSRTGSGNGRFGLKLERMSSKYYGVTFHKRDGKWDCNIKVNGKQIWLKSWKIEEDAARAYDKYVIEHSLPNPCNFNAEVLQEII